MVVLNKGYRRSLKDDTSLSKKLGKEEILLTSYDGVNSPNVEVCVEILFQGSLKNELQALIESCKGEHPDPFGHLKYWKCMLALIPYVVEGEVKRGYVKDIAKQIGFSEDQVVRSLDRFVDKEVLVKGGIGSYSVWKLDDKRFPIICFLCVKKRLTHIVRHYLALSVTQAEPVLHNIQE